MLLIAFFLLLSACTTTSPASPNVSVFQAQNSPTAAPASPTATDTEVQTVTETPTSTPAVTSTFPASATPTYDSYSATLIAQMGVIAILEGGGISLYLNPTGTPVQVWRDVPIMSQATSGQEFTPNVYSYIATASLNQAGQFYASKAASLGLPNTPSTGYGGTGSLASHQTVYMSFNLFVYILSYDNDPGHVTVIIAKT